MQGTRMKLLLVACFIGLALSMKPEIIEGPRDVTVRQGDDVTLRCVVEHLPSKDLNPVQWTRKDFALGYDRNLSNWKRYSMVGDISIGEYNLHIKNVSAIEDEGNYECQVTEYLLRSKKAKLTVLVPPTGPIIEDGIEDDKITKVNVVLGKENEINCHGIRGKPAATLHWYRNGIELFDEVTSLISEPKSLLYNTTATLRFIPKPGDDDVTYACVMTSEALPQDTISRKLVKLNLLRPPIVSAYLPPVIKDGDYVNAECKAMAKPPATSYRWYVNGNVQMGEVTSIFGLGIVNRTWNGQSIACEAKNEAGFSARSQVDLNILYAPILVKSSGEVTAEIGGNVTMTCEWEANPKPTVYWLKGDEVFPSNTLELRSVTQLDSGEYSCFASAGEFEEQQASTTLIVRGPPILSSDSVQNALLGKDAVVNCALSSYPGIDQVTWSWKKFDKNFRLSVNESKMAVLKESGTVKYQGNITPQGRVAQLKIMELDKNDLHSYSCSVANSYGSKFMSIDLEEDTSDAIDGVLLGASVGGAILGLILILLLILFVGRRCLQTRREHKSTNFDKQRRNMNNFTAEAVDGKMYSEDETIPINHSMHMPDDEYNVRSSLSSHGGAPDSTVSGSVDTNPTPTSGQDDGYHTEEANSWNRGDAAGKSSSAYPVKNQHQGYVVALPPTTEAEQPLYADQFENMDSYPEYPPRPMSVNQYPYDQLPYDPTALAPPVSTIRSASALDDRLPPHPVRYVHRNFSNVSPSRVGMYSPAPDQYYPPGGSPYNRMNSVVEPTPSIGSQSFVGGSRSTPIPTGRTDHYYQVPVASSQSSLDKFERESALSASAAAPRIIDPYENAGRMSNLSARLSQTSRSSEFSKPLIARMATHV